MTIDISKIRPGDEVTVRAPVIDVGPSGYVWANLGGGYPAVLLDARTIVSHTPTALQPGDRVRSRALAAGVYEVVAAPRVRTDGVTEVALWSEASGYLGTGVDGLERV